MKVNYNNGKIEFDFHEILEQISPEKRIELIEYLACDDAIIQHVSDQIIYRWTDGSCCGSSNCTIPSDSSKGTPLDNAWRRVAKLSNDVAKNEIEQLEKGLALRDNRIEELVLENYNLRTKNRT